MVVTKHFLAEKLGLDFEIAEFFADRKVPRDNLYWKNRFLYLTFGTGYLFIPVIMDALYKAGVDKKVILDPRRIGRMETAFDIVARHETKKISFETYIDEMAAVFSPYSIHDTLLDGLTRYFKNAEVTEFNLGTPLPALNRADAFLFTFCDLPVEQDKLAHLIEIWYHVAVTVLMLDDLVDLEDDRKNGEENAVLEAGDNQDAVKKCTAIIENHLAGLKKINPTVEGFFRKVLDNALLDPQITQLPGTRQP